MSKDPKFPIYLYPDAQYQEIRKKRFESEIYEAADEIQSQWKKPYLSPEHPRSERELWTPGRSPSPPPYDGGAGTGDCEVGGDAIGGGWTLCDPSDNCGKWVFRCAHKITSITPVGGWFKSIVFKGDDTVEIVFCSDFDAGSVLIDVVDGTTITTVFERECLGDDPNPDCTSCSTCPETSLSIGYTSLQMTVSGTQALWVSLKGGGGPYSWSITSGGGSLNTSWGTQVIYTAPASNAECAQNPTIQVKDYCGNIATLTLAINEYEDDETALVYVRWRTFDGTTECTVGPDCYAQTYHYTKCSGEVNELLGAQICSAACAGASCVQCQPTCAMTCVIAGCCTNPNPCGGDCSQKTIDSRTEEMITAGCCPAGLL